MGGEKFLQVHAVVVNGDSSTGSTHAAKQPAVNARGEEKESLGSVSGVFVRFICGYSNVTMRENQGAGQLLEKFPLNTTCYIYSY